MESNVGEVTLLLREMAKGSPEAADRLFPLVYAELRHQAAAYMRRERRDHTLQATALVHDAYIRLVGQHDVDWRDRGHFFAVCAKVMRRILIDHARARTRLKRGGEDHHRVEDNEIFLLSDEQSVEVLVVHEALLALAELDSRQAKVVE